ncbi:hypothetical protein Q7P36_009672 [Cladosporium allicinum]
MAPTPSASSSSSSSLRKTFNGLPRELRDYIYELVYDRDLYVVLGRRLLRVELRHQGAGPFLYKSCTFLFKPIGKRTLRRRARYHRHQRAFMEEFLFTSDRFELWKLFATGPLLLVSMKGAKDLTIWIGDTLELEFNARRDGIFEAALLQFAVMGTVDALSVKKWGDAFDNSGDEDARWHEVNWMELRPVCVLRSLFLSCWLFGVM